MKRQCNSNQKANSKCIEFTQRCSIIGLQISRDAISSLVTNHFGKLTGKLTGKGIEAFTATIIPELNR